MYAVTIHFTVDIHPASLGSSSCLLHCGQKYEETDYGGDVGRIPEVEKYEWSPRRLAAEYSSHVTIAIYGMRNSAKSIRASVSRDIQWVKR